MQLTANSDNLLQVQDLRVYILPSILLVYAIPAICRRIKRFAIARTLSSSGAVISASRSQERTHRHLHDLSHDVAASHWHRHHRATMWLALHYAGSVGTPPACRVAAHRKTTPAFRGLARKTAMKPKYVSSACRKDASDSMHARSASFGRKSQVCHTAWRAQIPF